MSAKKILPLFLKPERKLEFDFSNEKINKDDNAYPKELISCIEQFCENNQIIKVFRFLPKSLWKTKILG